MPKWSDTFVGILEERFGANPSREDLLSEFAWVEELHRKAGENLSPEALENAEPHEIYSRLKELSLPKFPLRLTNLGRENQAGDVAEMVRRLLLTKGGYREKLGAAKVPQAGVVTLTGILCLCRPHRFLLRSTAFTRGAAKAIPLYGLRALNELSYEDFFDLCTELARVQTAYFSLAGLGKWAERLKFLLLYAILAV